MAGEQEPHAQLCALEAEYEIVGELGRGGISVVYLARDRELGREVAIKVIRESFHHDAEASARFEREARTLAQLHHPNIITLYAAKRLPDASLALVMQFTRGESLRTLLRQGGPFSVERAEQVLRDIGDALTYVHRQGVIHRDIKPENIFFDEQSGRALLSDFGIAKAHDGLANVTLAGVVVGTPAYMSPEQIDGTQLDGLSDLYSLGLVGYELLTGQQPWEGENLYSIIIKQKGEKLPSLETVRPDVPLHLRLAIERAIEKDRGQRWRSAEEFVAQLEQRPSSVPLGRPAPSAEVTDEHASRGALADREKGVTIEFNPAALLHTAPSLPARRRRNRVYLAAAAVVLLAGGTATIPLINAGMRSIHAADVADLPTVAAQTAERMGATEMGHGVPRGAAQRREPSPRTASATMRAQEESEITARSARLSALDSSLSVPRQMQLAMNTEPVEEIAPQPILSSRTPRPVTSGLVVTRPAVEPVLRNPANVERLMNTLYSSVLSERRAGGTVTVLLLIDETGTVIQGQVKVSSGHTALDNAALRIGRSMKFSPAEDQGRRVRTHVEVPLVFQANAIEK